MSKDPCTVTLKRVRLSYPHIFKPRAFTDGAEPAYQGAFLLDKDKSSHQKQIDAVDEAIEAAKEKLWGNKPPKIKKRNIAFRDGDDPGEDEEVRPENEGQMIVSARNYKRPLVIDRDKSPLTEGDGVIYGGCYVDAIVRYWAQDYRGTSRVNCSLEAVKFNDDGDPFGAAPLTPDAFDDDGDEDDRRSSRRRDDDDDDRRSSRKRDDDDDDRRSSRRRDDDDDEDRPPRNSRSQRRRDDDI